MAGDQSQELASHVAAGTEYDGWNGYTHVVLSLSSSATLSPSATPFESALIAGSEVRSSICCTPTSLSVAGPVTRAGSILNSLRNSSVPPHADTGSLAHRTTDVSASRMSGSDRIAPTP